MAGVVAIVLVAPGTDLVSWAIDRMTGSRGWSHCFVDPGWASNGDPVVVDISRPRGVEFSTWSKASENRPTKRLELEHGAGRCMLDSLIRCIGKPYNLTAMVLQPVQRELLRGIYCSTVIADCLPADLRARLPTCPSPADLLELERSTRRV